MPIVLPVVAVGDMSGSAGVALKGTGDAVPPGIDSILEYRGAYFNIRAWADTYLITEIDGLGDADIRDQREVNPGHHGETIFESLYGGRSVVLTGRIRAFTLDKLRDLQQGLRQTFSDISTEYPLIFHAKEPINDCLIFCKKNGPIAMKESQTNFMFSRDFMIPLRASNPRILSVVTNFAQWSGGAVDGFTTDATVTGRNLLPNPDAEASPNPNARWTPSATADDDFGIAPEGFQGTQSFKLTRNGAGFPDDISMQSEAFLCYPNQTVRGIAYFKADSLSRDCRLNFVWENGDTPVTNGPTVTDQVGDWIICSAEANAPSGTTGVSLRPEILDVEGGESHLVDALAMTVDQSLTDSFSGDTNTGINHRWTGAANNSSSERFSANGLENNWIGVSNFAGASVRHGSLIVSTWSEMKMIRKGLPSRPVDCRLTIKMTTPPNFPTGVSTEFGVLLKRQDSNNELMIGCVLTNPSLGAASIRTYKRTGGGAFVQFGAGSNFNVTLLPNTTYWMRAGILGNLISAELFASDPTNSTPTPIGSFTNYALAGADATLFGASVEGDVGLRANNTTDEWRVDDFRVEMLGTTGSLITTLINRGNFPAQPQIQLTGPISDPYLTFVDNENDEVIGYLMFNAGSVIPAGSTWFIDIAKKSMVDQNGNNLFPKLSVNSDWPELVPGATGVQLSGSAMDHRTSCTVMWRDTWI